MSENDGLGSLAQSSRGSALKSTRMTLWVIGGLTLAVNGFQFTNATNEIRGLNVPAENFDQVLGLVQMIYGAGAAVGLIFILCGIFLEKYPVPLTILSLILYVGGTAGFAYLDPTSLMRGVIVKVIIVVSLGKAVQTALAYQRERDAEQASF